jgi:hypothetical protein
MQGYKRGEADRRYCSMPHYVHCIFYIININYIDASPAVSILPEK